MEAIFTKTISFIRDVLRAEGKTGTEAVAHCILFVTSRYLTPALCEHFGIPVEYAFCNMLPDGVIINDHDLYHKFYVNSNIVDSFYKYFQQKLGFKSLKFNIKSPRNLHLMLNELKKVDITQLQLSHDIIGLVYEIYLSDGNADTMRGLGQYFTPRPIIRYMVNLCDPGVKDGRVETILDPSMGSGGFLTLAYQHVIAKYPNTDKKLLNDAIYGMDIDQNVRDMALFNLFLESSIKFSNLYQGNTLLDDIRLNDGTLLNKVDVVLANPPMGGKGPEYKDCCERIRDLKIPGNKNEPLFTQLIMQTLNENGRCAIIVPEGFLFAVSKHHVNTRKYMLENFNVKKVVEIPKGSFFNTTIGTYIIYFENTEQKTTEVVFSEINFDVTEKVNEVHRATINIAEIITNKYVLLYKHYLKHEKKYANIRYFKLSDVCSYTNKSKRLAGEGKGEGLYPYFTSSNEVKRIDIADYNEEYLIIGTGGSANIKIATNFSCSSDNFLLKSKFPSMISNKYLYHYLNNNIELIEKTFRGTGLGHPTKDGILSIEVPVPDIVVQNHIVTKCENDLHLIKLLQKRIKKIMNGIPLFVSDILSKYDCDKNIPLEKNMDIDEINKMIDSLKI